MCVCVCAYVCVCVHMCVCVGGGGGGGACERVSMQKIMYDALLKKLHNVILPFQMVAQIYLFW